MYITDNMSANDKNSQSDISFMDEQDDLSCSLIRTNSANIAQSIKMQNISDRGEPNQTHNNIKPVRVCSDEVSKLSNAPSIIIPGSFQFIDDADCKPWSTPDPPCENIENNKIEQNENENYSCTTMTVSANGEKRRPDIPCINIPGSFDFIDDIETSPLTINSSHPSETSLCSKCETEIPSPALSDTQIIFKIPSIYLPSNLEYIDDLEHPDTRTKKLHRGDKTHSSLKIPKGQSSKRRLCRHHSDSETKTGDTAQHKPRQHRSRSRRVRRSISAIETNKNGFKPRVRRSFSDRSGMIIAGKHLHPPRSRSRQSHYENGSSRCSSTKTLSTNVSISEIVAVEMGYKDIPGLTAKEARRRRVVCTVMIVFITIIVLSVLLIGVTLLLSPVVDDVLRKGNEEIYRSMGAGASTSSPTTEGAAVVANNSAPPSGSPG